MPKSAVLTILTAVCLVTGLWLISGFSRPSVTVPVNLPKPQAITGQPEVPAGTDILFVGDMMFNRGVDNYIRKNGIDYPFRQIKPLFSEADVVVANLEGPVVSDPVSVSADSMRFNFSPDIVPVLSRSHVGLVSLANNHTLDRGKTGLTQTREFLSAGGIAAVGHPLTCGDEASAAVSDQVFLAFNTTFPSGCRPDALTAAVSRNREFYPDKFLAVLIHWGWEYQPVSHLSQRDLAHRLIAAGADVIIGHHPHVVQEIELYMGKPVFYSIGNFIFDQYFSVPTQMGMAVGAEVSPGSVAYRLYPLDLTNSQPRLMSAAQSRDFFSGLAARSSPDLSAAILSGKLTTAR